MQSRGQLIIYFLSIITIAEEPLIRGKPTSGLGQCEGALGGSDREDVLMTFLSFSALLLRKK